MKMEQTITFLIGLRKSRRISQLKLSKEMRLDQKEISLIENGKRPLKFPIVAEYLKAVQSISTLELNDEDFRCMFDAIHEDVNKDAIEIISKAIPISSATINKISKNKVFKFTNGRGGGQPEQLQNQYDPLKNKGIKFAMERRVVQIKPAIQQLQDLSDPSTEVKSAGSINPQESNTPETTRHKCMAGEDISTKTKLSNFFRLFRGEKMNVLLSFLSLGEKEQNTIFSIAASEPLRNIISQLNSIPKTRLQAFHKNLHIIMTLIEKPFTKHVQQQEKPEADPIDPDPPKTTMQKEQMTPSV